MKMFKKFRILSAVLLIAAGFLLEGCADVNGLHNQEALPVTFQFKNFGSTAGTYAVPGNFNSWDNTNADVVLKDGHGTSEAIYVTDSNIQFSLVPQNEWTRVWYVENSCYGNGMDEGRYQNFYIDGLDLSAGEATIIVDASNGTVTVQ